MIHKALVPGGDLVFTIEHPIFMVKRIPIGLLMKTVARPGRSMAIRSRANAARTGSPRAC